MIQIIGLTSSLSWTHMPNCCGWLERTIEWEFKERKSRTNLDLVWVLFRRQEYSSVLSMFYLFSHPIFVSFSFHPVCNSFLLSLSLFVFLTVSLSLTMSVWCGSKGQRSRCQAAGLSGIWSLTRRPQKKEWKERGWRRETRGYSRGEVKNAPQSWFSPSLFNVGQCYKSLEGHLECDWSGLQWFQRALFSVCVVMSPSLLQQCLFPASVFGQLVFGSVSCFMVKDVLAWMYGLSV